MNKKEQIILEYVLESTKDIRRRELEDHEENYGSRDIQQISNAVKLLARGEWLENREAIADEVRMIILDLRLWSRDELGVDL